MTTAKTCQSMKASGGQCTKNARPGSDFCGEATHKDGSATRKAMEKAKKQQEAKAAQEEAERLSMLADLEIVRLRVRRSGEAPAAALARCDATFTRWLSEAYDLDSLHATLATMAVERLDGDPVWLLVVSGSGNTKTETVAAAAGAGAYVESTIISAAALLSATPEAEIQAGATGGLLVRIGKQGTLVLKDVTSILSMAHTARAEVLAALREIYDGRWTRNVGTGGGLSLDWEGRVVLIGAVTTDWDTHHAVIAAMGDRFVLIRTDSADKAQRRIAGAQAAANVGSESQMREELREAFGAVLAAMHRDGIALTDEEVGRLLSAADLVALGRTAVEFDYQRNPIAAHAPEAATRLTKQLVQLVRGGVAIGLDRNAAMRLAIRCARDSMPPLRLELIDCLAEYATSERAEVGEPFFVRDIRQRINKPLKTVDRELQAMHLLDLVEATEHPYGDEGRVRWAYQLAHGIDPNTLRTDAM